VILAYARSGEEERIFWRDAMAGRRASDDDLEHAIRRLRHHRAIDDTIARARYYGQRAIDALGAFPPSKAKAALVEAVEFATSRAY
jgi:octaprenyl-diphosphate synthase